MTATSVDLGHERLQALEPVPLVRRPFTVDEYEQLVEYGILTPEDKVELIAGDIVRIAPTHSPHSACVTLLDEMLTEALGKRAQVRVQQPLLLPPDSEPEPDLAVVRRKEGNYRRHHPEPADVLLLIEVSDSSVRKDRDVKAPLYAAAGVPEFWIVDVTSGEIGVYRDPREGLYRTVSHARRGETVSPASFPDVALSVTEIVGDDEAE